MWIRMSAQFDFLSIPKKTFKLALPENKPLSQADIQAVRGIYQKYSSLTRANVTISELQERFIAQLESQYAEQAIERDNQILQAEQLYTKNNKESAKDLLLSLDKKWPNNARILGNLGVIIWNEQDSEKALEYLTKAYDAGPNEAGSLTNLINAYLLKNNKDAALSVLQHHAKHHFLPDNLLALYEKLSCEIDLLSKAA